MKCDMKKDEGFIQYALCVILIAICALIMLFSLRMRIVQEQKMYIEDAITASALASCVLDLNEFGTYGYIRSGSNNEWDGEEQNLFNIFVDNLKLNLNLNDSMYPNNTNGIITSKVKVVNFWVYSKTLEDVDGSYIRDYNGNWVQQHYETPDYTVFKYEANRDSNGIVKDGYRITSNNTNLPILYTPKDTNIVTLDAYGSFDGTDAAGEGQVLVDGMTIYCTIQFSVNPFGYNSNDDYKDGLFNVGSLIGDTVITKSVVVSIKSTK